MAKVFTLPLDGIDIGRKAAMELIERMNKFWPGEYWLEWFDGSYSNAAANPLISTYCNQMAANIFPAPDPFDKYPKVEGWGFFPAASAGAR